MALTFGCEDVGGDWCQYRMFVNAGEEDLIVDSTIKHAKIFHTEFAADALEAERQIRSKISDLLRQSKFYEQKSQVPNLFGLDLVEEGSLAPDGATS